MAKESPACLVVWLTTLATLVSCASSRPDLLNCTKITSGPRCHSESIALPPAKGRMAPLYENGRAIIFVNPDRYLAYLDEEVYDPNRQRLIQRAIDEGKPRQMPEGSESSPEVRLIIKAARTGDIAIYDKVRRSCVPVLWVEEIDFEWFDENGRQWGGSDIDLALPDCTRLLYWTSKP